MLETLLDQMNARTEHLRKELGQMISTIDAMEDGESIVVRDAEIVRRLIKHFKNKPIDWEQKDDHTVFKKNHIKYETFVMNHLSWVDYGKSCTVELPDFYKHDVLVGMFRECISKLPDFIMTTDRRISKKIHIARKDF
jgi:hypothetical protein